MVFLLISAGLNFCRDIIFANITNAKKRRSEIKDSERKLSQKLVVQNLIPSVAPKHGHARKKMT